MRNVPQPRRFKARGIDMSGNEVRRNGDQVTLMAAPLNWPFVVERTYSRAELVRLDGDNCETVEEERDRSDV